MESSNPENRYYPKSRTEKLIASGRMVLSAFFLLAIWLDPSEPSRYALLTYGILTGFLLYSLLLGRLAWRTDYMHGRLQLVTHSVDLLIFAVLMFLTDGSSSPFFVYFIFLTVCATLRWQLRGTCLTAAAALAIVVALAWFPSNLLHDQSFELNRFIIRIAYLAVVATLLGYLGAHEQSMRNILSVLAEWPRPVPGELQAMLGELLAHAATILDAPRVVLVWEEEEEPWLHLASWSPRGIEYRRENAAVFGTLVAEPLVGTSFFCQGAAAPRALVVRTSSTGLQRYQGAPLQGQLQQLLAVDAVLGSWLKGEEMSGYLLALDKPLMTADDLVLGGIVAHELAARLDHFFLLRQLRHAAAAEERIRLARDLHDGLLQSLAGAALQLETAHRLMESDPQKAQQRIQGVQRLLAAEQRDLRSQISELRPFPPGRQPEDFGLQSRLEELAERIRRQWDVSVEMETVAPLTRISRGIAREIFLIVQESLINAARHADASTLRVRLGYDPDRVRVTVADDGHGFPFLGLYDQDALFEMKRGPVTLKERIAALGGTLSIDSRETGARLEIALPLNGMEV